MDITETLAPRSDQQNFEDYLTGPKLVTISGVSQGNAEQPVNIELAEFPGRPYKPNKTMRRLIVSAWGASTDVYVGRRMKLVGNPAVIFGGKAVGGVEVEALSHIDKPLTVNLTTTRGKRKPFTVKPLTEPAPTSSTSTISAEDIQTWVDLLHHSDTLETLQRNWALATTEKVSSVPQIVAAKNARKSELGA